MGTKCAGILRRGQGVKVVRVGLDLSVIQTPHRMRGIGATAINFINAMPSDIKKSHTFVFFFYKEGLEEALSILDLNDITYEIRHLSAAKKSQLKLPGKLKLINSVVNSYRKMKENSSGDPRVGGIDDLDAYLCFDQMQSLPRKNKRTKRAIVIYDLIPYVMEDLYLWSYKTARKHGNSRKAALRKSMLRKLYLGHLRGVGREADMLFAISAYTKADFVKYTGTPDSKVHVVPLGVNPIEDAKSSPPKQNNFEHYIDNSWGSFPHPITLDDKPFLLFVGGADPRRKLLDLFSAYNNLKAEGNDIRLVLAGDTMKGVKSLPTSELQKYVAQSSYKNDIAFLGFVTDEQREWLYKHALAMVYPSTYEGFGLPVLEAMRYGTPVITYKNTSIFEIAESAALYANDALSIKAAAEKLLDNKSRDQYIESGKQQAAKFPWSKTVRSITKLLGS